MGSINDLKILSPSEGSIERHFYPQKLDTLVIGAGFGGVYQLKALRDAGYSVKLVEAGSDYGGVWYWNRYPGARVDSAIPHYEFSDPALWKDWMWKQRFPGDAELRAYFKHVAERWDLRRDTQFDTFVESVRWSEGETRWTVRTRAGETYRVKFLFLNTGFAAKRYVQYWKDVDAFEGTFLHPSNWPHKEPDLRKKRVAVIGTGSTGVQIAQELSQVASQLTVFQRTPNMSLPMVQVEYNLPEQALSKSEYPDLFANRVESFGGFSFNFLPRSTFDDTPEQRQKTYEELWKEGDLKFLLATFDDMLFTKEANREAYNFRRNKTREKIHDRQVGDIIAPMEQPHPFACKRVSLERGYFEMYSQPNVALVDVGKNGTSIQDITKKGVKTSDGVEREFDFIVSATGYDAITGGLTQIDIRGPSGKRLSEHWKDGARTYLGLAVSGFTNMFFTYGPQAPTAL